MSTIQWVLILELFGLIAAVVGIAVNVPGRRNWVSNILIGLGSAMLVGGLFVAVIPALTGTWVS